MADNSLTIAFSFNGIDYKGWATPSDKLHPDGTPRSFHVVLNDTMFGNVSFTDGKWVVDEQRPGEMTELVGGIIDRLTSQHPVRHSSL